ncbi:ADCY7 [Cervus elaphus hippelaphus]|uniref:ADCY7 n=1 Tax=Cervus elaphus hippelaphus TaxID=46360 RepID=A0A212DDH5_CEREH|nr:ADCY7 [Cervus elaphus hippelaphus]
MPAKGRYFLNEGEEGPDQDALYEKYRLTSQHGPLLLALLHRAILGTAFFTLAVFVVLYALVYVECLDRRGLRVSALLTWACLVTLGYVLVFDFDLPRKDTCAWGQVRFGG